MIYIPTVKTCIFSYHLSKNIDYEFDRWHFIFKNITTHNEKFKNISSTPGCFYSFTYYHAKIVLRVILCVLFHKNIFCVHHNILIFYTYYNTIFRLTIMYVSEYYTLTSIRRTTIYQSKYEITCNSVLKLHLTIPT